MSDSGKIYGTEYKSLLTYGNIKYVVRLDNSVCAKFAQTADDGKTYNYKFYSLSAIVAVGYRTNSERATKFRTWATLGNSYFSYF